MSGSKADKGIVRLQGKDYKTVALRMSEFRERFGIKDGWAVVTNIHAITENAVLFRAEIRNPDGLVVGTGHASGTRKGSKALEKCETTAIGRALAAIGLSGEEYASADEIAAWMEDRERPEPAPLVDAPMEEPRKPQQSAQAPTKWSEQDRKRFCGALSGVGLRYDDVAGFCEAEGWGRPSGWGGRVPCDRFIADLGISWNAAEKRWESKTTELRERLDSFLNAGG